MKKHLPVNLSVFFLCCLFSAASLQAQNVITTVAGGGTNYANGVLATVAKLSTPHGVEVDAAGNIYIAVTGQNKIRKVTGGYINTIAGTGLNSWGGDGGPATAAYINGPRSLCLDAAGNLYFADYWNIRTRMINTSGIISHVAGNGTPTQYINPGLADTSSTGYNSGIAFDASGRLYIAASAGGRVIYKVEASGIMNHIAGNWIGGCAGDGGPALSANLNCPDNMAIDAAGNIYISDFCCNVVRRVDASGIIHAFAGTGTPGFSGDGGPATSAQLNYPNNVKLDHAGNLYIADGSNHRIRKVELSTGIITTVAGNGVAGFSGDGGPAVSAQIYAADAMAIDNANNLYIADQGNDRIRKITMGACNAYFYIYPDTGVSGLYYGRNLATGSNLTYLWSFGDGATSTQQYPSHTYASSGQYYVCLTINNGAGCVTTYCDSSYLVFKTDDGLMNQLTILAPGSVGVEEVKSNKFDFVLSPNPSSESVAITIPETLIGSTATITDITGREIISSVLQIRNPQFDIRNLADGIYFVTLSNGSQSAIRKLVVSK